MRILAFLLFFLFSSQALAQNFYGVADFSKRNGYPRDGAIAIWENLDPGATGDLLQGVGNVESPFVVDVACGFCPSGCTCACAGTSAITQESTEIYKNSKSIKYVVDAGNDNVQVFFTLPNLDVGKKYEITFQSKGNVGLEDILARVQGQPAPYGATPNVYYASATDVWGGAIDIGFANIPITWRINSIYVAQNTVSQLRNAQLSIRRNGASQTFFIDDVQIRELRDSSSTSQPGGYKFEQVVTSDPIYNSSKTLTVVDGQRDKRELEFNGSTDFMRMATDVDAFDFVETGDFTYCSESIADTVVANSVEIAKYGANRSWYSYYSGTSRNCYVAKDLVPNYTAVGKVYNSLIQASGCCIYDFKTDGTSQLQSCMNHETSCSISNVAVGPPYNSTARLSIADIDGGGAANWDGSISRIAIYKRPITAKEYSLWVSPYFFGHKETTGFYVTTCTQAASHASCGFEKCIDGAANRCMADTDWMPIFGSYIERWPNNSFENSGSGDSNYVPTSHAITKTVGDGTSEVSAYRVNPQHGNLAVRVRLTGTSSAAVIQETVCQTTGIGSDIYTYVREKTLSGRVNTAIQILEYDTNACGTLLATTNIATATGEVNRWLGGKFAAASWNGSTSSYLVQIVETGDNGVDVTFDSASLEVVSYHTPWNHNSGVGTTTTSARDYRIHNPLADYVSSKQEYEYQDGFCMGMWVWTDFAWNDVTAHYFAEIAGTAGSNNRIIWYKTAANVLSFRVYDSAGADWIKQLNASAANWPAGMKFLEACTSNTGVTKARHYNVTNSTWYDWNIDSGAGTKIQAGQTAVLNMAESSGGTVQIDGYIGPFVIGPYSAVWPMYGFDNRPVQNPH